MKNDYFEIVVAIIPIIGGLLAIFAPKQGIDCSRDFLATLHMEKHVPEFFFSVALCRVAGVIGLLFGLTMLLTWLLF